MELIDSRLIKAIDRLAHHSTDDVDALNSVRALRRLTKGEMPSRLLRLDESERGGVSHPQILSLKRTIKQLQSEKKQLTETNALLRQEKAALETQLQQNKNVDGTYTYDGVMSIILKKLGKHGGGLLMWANYSEAQHALNPDLSVVTLAKLSKWRKEDAFPVWAVRQLMAMPAVVRRDYKWSEEDVEFLRSLHLTNPSLTETELAAACTEQFGCTINTNSIKSKFNLLRRRGTIPPRR